MKKIISLIVAVVMATCIFTSCGNVIEEFDSKKTQIFVVVFNGGYGTEWFEDLKNRFNAQNDKYEIIPDYKKMEAKDVITDLSGGDTRNDVYFSCGVDFQEGIYKNYFEDLSDVLNMKASGENKTIGEKMVDLNLWKQVSSQYGEGMYILPHSETMMGIVFDYQLFVKNNWLEYATSNDISALQSQGITYREESGKLLFVSSTGKVNYKANDIILTAGKDGKFGTYDDGQPATMEDFDEMLDKITTGNDKNKTFIFSGVAENYLNDVLSSVIAQYMGVENYKVLFNYNSNGAQIPMHNDSIKAITLENGYEIFKSEGVYQGLNFVEKYLSSADVDDHVLETTSFSHTDAQSNFILGLGKTESPAMLCEGTWWENEARATFDNLAKENAERGYGKREYRYMLIPAMNGQVTATNKSVIGGAEYAGVVVKKQKDAEKLAKIKEFLAFCASDESLVNFTKYSGCKKYYNYSMSDADLNKLTPFARSCWEIYADKENVTVIPSRLYQSANPLTFNTTYINNCYVPLLKASTYTMYPARYFRPITADGTTTVADLYGKNSSWLGYSQTQWSEFIQQAKDAGFYKN